MLELTQRFVVAVAVRGVPIGLMHAVGGFDPATVVEETRIVTRTSHPGVAQHQLTLDVALSALVCRVCWPNRRTGAAKASPRWEGP